MFYLNFVGYTYMFILFEVYVVMCRSLDHFGYTQHEFANFRVHSKNKLLGMWLSGDLLARLQSLDV